MSKIFSRECLICKTQFSSAYLRKTTCSQKCRRIYKIEYNQNWRGGLALHKCICGVEFVSIHNRKTCSKKCSNVRRSAQQSARYAANPERTKENQRRWRAANPDKVRATRERNADSIREASLRWWNKKMLADPEYGARQSRKWRANNPERAKEVQQQWNQANADRMAELQRRWKAANPERVRETDRKSKAKHYEKNKEMTRRWKEENREYTREYARQRYADYPEHMREIRIRFYANNREQILKEQREKSAKFSALVKAYRNFVKTPLWFWEHYQLMKFDRATHRATARALEKQLMENRYDLH